MAQAGNLLNDSYIDLGLVLIFLVIQHWVPKHHPMHTRVKISKEITANSLGLLANIVFAIILPNDLSNIANKIFSFCFGAINLILVLCHLSYFPQPRLGVKCFDLLSNSFLFIIYFWTMLNPWIVVTKLRAFQISYELVYRLVNAILMMINLGMLVWKTKNCSSDTSSRGSNWFTCCCKLCGGLSICYFALCFVIYVFVLVLVIIAASQ